MPESARSSRILGIENGSRILENILVKANDAVNSEIFARAIFSRNFAKFRENKILAK